jgi:Na+-driven multidrug efflux pump
MSGKASLRFDFTAFRLDTSLLFRIARQGIPASLQMLSVSLNRLAIFGIVGGFGTSVTAAYTLGLNIDMFVFMSVFAVAMTVEVATGQNIGAGKLDRVHLFHRSAVRQLAILMLLLAAAVWFFGEPFVRLYTTNPDTISEAVRYLHTTVFGYVFFAVGLATVRVFSGAGAPFLSMSITAGGLLGLQLPLAWILSHSTPLAQHGVWIAIVVGYVLFSVVALLVYRRGVWQHARV